jgi:hypothetical protein
LKWDFLGTEVEPLFTRTLSPSTATPRYQMRRGHRWAVRWALSIRRFGSDFLEFFENFPRHGSIRSVHEHIIIVLMTPEWPTAKAH